jgi:predicted permease
MAVLPELQQDTRYALRGLRRNPAMSALAILMLALGIGANTAVFSIVNPLLLRPLPLKAADRLVWIANTENRGLSGATYRVDWYEELKRQSSAFEDMGAYFAFAGFFSRTLTGQGDPMRLAAVDIAPGFFHVLGVEPAAGRQFLDDEHRGPALKAAILGHGFWQRRFAGDPSIVGQAITINNTAVTVVGVMPESFDFSSVFTPGTGADLFLPADVNQMRSWGNTMALVGRLRPGVPIDQARAEFATLLPHLMQSHPEWGPVGAAVTDLKTHVSGPVRRSLLVLWGAVGFVLLIVCANVTNLLLARASARRREFAVRGALGASRGRLFRQVLTEGVLLSATGALLGIPIAYGLTMWLTRTESMSIPLLHYARVDMAALGLTALVACVAGLAGAVVPALRLSGQSPQNALREQSRGTTDSAGQAWTGRALVVAEIALAAVLLVGAGLLGRSFTELLSVNLGFEPAQAVAARVDLPAGLRRPQQTAIAREILRRVAAAPGVDAAGLTDALPLDTNRTWGIAVPGRTYGPGEQPSTFVYVVSPGYLQAMGITVTAGRDFIHDDPMVESSPVVINETLARVLYPHEDPIGRPATSNTRRLTIVGVVADVRQTSLDEQPANQMYLDLSRGGGTGSNLIVRSGLTASALASALRRLLSEVDSRVLVTEVRPVEALVERSVSPRRFLVQLTAGFSVFALMLASLGIYGVVSYHVGQRTAEIGVRMALGATGGEVRRRMLSDTLTLAISGIAIGGVLAFLLSGVIRALLFSTSANDPVVFGATGLVLLMVAALAGLIPALRASRIDPARALRAG